MARRVYKRDRLGRFAGSGSSSKTSSAKRAVKKTAVKVKASSAIATTAKTKRKTASKSTATAKDGVLDGRGKTLGGSKNTIVKQRVIPYDDPYSPQARAAKTGRAKRLDRVASALEQGRFARSSSDSYRVKNGKMTALEALNDAKDPRIGLISAQTNKGEATGFLSYKPGRSSIEIMHLGTDGKQKGAGRSLMRGVLEVAARENKGIVVSSSPEAVGFYRRMGLKDMGSGSDFALSAAEVKKLLKRR